MPKLRASFGLDADQHRTEIARRFLQILEADDVVFGAEKPEKVAQARRAAAGIGRRSISSGPRSAAPAPSRRAGARNRNCRRKPPQPASCPSTRAWKILERVDGQRAGGLQHDAFDVQHFDHGRAEPVFRNEMHGLRGKILEMAQRLAADFGDRRAIDEIVDLGSLTRLPVSNGLLEARRARRLAEDITRRLALRLTDSALRRQPARRRRSAV